MNAPNKPLADWTFDELKSWACWNFIECIAKGEALSSIMHGILTVAMQWRADQDAGRKGVKR